MIIKHNYISRDLLEDLKYVIVTLVKEIKAHFLIKTNTVLFFFQVFNFFWLAFLSLFVSQKLDNMVTLCYLLNVEEILISDTYVNDPNSRVVH